MKLKKFEGCCHFLSFLVSFFFFFRERRFAFVVPPFWVLFIWEKTFIFILFCFCFFVGLWGMIDGVYFSDWV